MGPKIEPGKTAIYGDVAVDHRIREIGTQRQKNESMDRASMCVCQTMDEIADIVNMYLVLQMRY
jgi:hypothetical protein